MVISHPTGSRRELPQSGPESPPLHSRRQFGPRIHGPTNVPESDTMDTTRGRFRKWMHTKELRSPTDATHWFFQAIFGFQLNPVGEQKLRMEFPLGFFARCSCNRRENVLNCGQFSETSSDVIGLIESEYGNNSIAVVKADWLALQTSGLPSEDDQCV